MMQIEILSEILIGALKELRNTGEPVTPSSLSHILSSNKKFFHLLSRIGSAQSSPASNAEMGQLSDGEFHADEEFPGGAKEKVEPEQTGIIQRANFYKQSILALIHVARDTRNPDLLSSLARFRSLVLEDADLEKQEMSLRRIKDAILKEDVKFSDSAAEEIGMQEVIVPVGTENDRHLRNLQQTFTAILEQLGALTREELLQKLSELRRRVHECKNEDTLLALGSDLIAIVKAYVTHASQEREQASQFVMELGKHFVGIEKHLFSYLTDSQEMFKDNEDFSQSLHLHMEGIEESFVLGETLEATKASILAKLTTIRNAVDQKRKQDEILRQRTEQKISTLQRNLQDIKEEIVQVQQRAKTLEREVLMDSLTGIQNRRGYEKEIEKEFERYKRYNQIFSLVLFDIDNFKSINDQFGHRAGDKCLRELIRMIKSSLRKTDCMARYGGEEFSIIFPGLDRERAHKAAEKVRLLTERTRFHFQRENFPVTISLGVTQVQPTDKNVESIFKRADAALYQAKRNGKNQVCIN